MVTFCYFCTKISLYFAKKAMYSPPFTISSKAINLIAEISAQIERYAIRLEQSDGLRLRKANRIKTIHSSLAIEGNNLTVGQVRDIINGKNVIAPIKEIQEVKNAIKTYELYPTLDPYCVADLLKAHGTMMMALKEDAGQFRRGGVGVFNEHGCVHMAPPADRVPYLIDELFDWLKHSEDHLLIRSCVFHYEFEFIHPFSDGNGRTGRLWQSLILGKLHPLFEHLPVENMVFANQQAYYDAITVSNDKGDCSPFIDFMLQEILNALKNHQGEAIDGITDNTDDGINDGINDGIKSDLILSDSEQKILTIIANSPKATAKDMAEALGIKPRQCERILSEMKKKEYIERVGANKNGMWIALVF